jgi:uncharacterized protein with PIN domain
MTVLERIVEDTREEVARRRDRIPLSELEAALDERLAGMRARMLAELALASRAADQSGQAPEGRARCPSCGARLEPRGTHRRTVVTDRGQGVDLERDYAVCPSCGTGLFPPG